jgi:hypothetical protein
VKQGKALAALLWGLMAGHEAVAAPGDITHTAQSAYTESRAGWRSVNSSFLRSDQGIVIEVRVTEYSSANSGEAPGTVDLVAWAHGDQKLWSAHLPGDSAGLWDDYLKVTEGGTSGAEDLMTYFDPASGRIAFLASSDPVFVEIANTYPQRKRVISWVSDHTNTALDFSRRHPGASGLLTMREGDKIVDRLVVTGTTWSPNVRLIDSSGHGADAGPTSELLIFGQEAAAGDAAFSRFSVRLAFDEDGAGVITIPVRDGRFVLDGLTLPKGVTLVHEAAE